MKIAVGHKILNLEELFTIATYSGSDANKIQVELVVDSQVYAELSKTAPKEAANLDDYPKDIETLSKEDARAILAVKVVQLLKLKANCQQATVDLLLKILNDDNLPEKLDNLFEVVFKIFNDNQLCISEKEKYIICSLPPVFLAKAALLAYKCREAQGYLNAILAFTMETLEFPADFYNEYNLTLRGRTTQGVTQFKN